MHSVSGPDPIMCLQTWVAFQKKKKKSTECRTAGCQLQVGFEELAESFRQHLASFTNKWSPQRFKVRLISFWDSAQNTGILNTESGASPWKPSISPPCPPPPTHIPSSTGVMWRTGPGGVFNFINIHSFIVNPGSKFSTVLLDGCSPLSPRGLSEMEF